MEITRESAEELVEQLQNAHRLSVAFYRRLLPTIDKFAAELGGQFCYWEPIENSMPCRSSTRPSSKWAWDFVPLYAASYVYWRTNGDTANPEDLGIAFRVYIEDSYSSKNRNASGIKGQPDPIELPRGEGLIQIILCRPAVKSSKAFSELWHQPKKIEALTADWTVIAPELEGVIFDWPLADLLCDDQKIINQLKNKAIRKAD